MTRHPVPEDEGTPADHIQSIEPRGDLVALAMPGYMAASRRLNRNQWNPGMAWNDLGLFSIKDAEDFLEGPIRAVAKGHTPYARGRVLTAMLAFALICVEADREQRAEERRDRLHELATGVSQEKPPEPEEDIPF